MSIASGRDEAASKLVPYGGVEAGSDYTNQHSLGSSLPAYVLMTKSGLNS